jgi:hypothetical protein
MPILIPTAGEIQRMTTGSGPPTRTRSPDPQGSSPTPSPLALDGWTRSRAGAKSGSRSNGTTGLAEADQARAILATMPPDPDVEWHRTLLQTALQ